MYYSLCLKRPRLLSRRNFEERCQSLCPHVYSAGNSLAASFVLPLRKFVASPHTAIAIAAVCGTSHPQFFCLVLLFLLQTYCKRRGLLHLPSGRRGIALTDRATRGCGKIPPSFSTSTLAYTSCLRLVHCYKKSKRLKEKSHRVI